MHPTIAVDYDGTICEFAFPKIGPENRNVTEALRTLHEQGWFVIIHSSRVNDGEGNQMMCRYVLDMFNWLLQHQVPFDDVWMEKGKPIAHFYIDDRGTQDLEAFSSMDLVKLAHRRYEEIERMWKEAGNE